MLDLQRHEVSREDEVGLTELRLGVAGRDSAAVTQVCCLCGKGLATTKHFLHKCHVATPAARRCGVAKLCHLQSRPAAAVQFVRFLRAASGSQLCSRMVLGRASGAFV